MAAWRRSPGPQGWQESTIRLGKQALTSLPHASDAPRRMRRHGAGRQPRTAQDQQLLQAVDALVEPTARGDPMSPLRWTCKSMRRLAKELGQQGHHVSHTTVGQLLKALNYSLQGTRKTREGTSHPDRNAQFEYINAQVKDFQQRGQPVVSVDTKRKKSWLETLPTVGVNINSKAGPSPCGCMTFWTSAWAKRSPTASTI